MPLRALEQSLGLLVATLPHAEVGESHEREGPVAAISALERVERVAELGLGLLPPAERNEDASVVGPARRHHEVRPRHSALDDVHPLLGAAHVGRVLACTEEAAADLADGAVRGHLPTGGGGHRLVEELHSLRDAAARHLALAQQRERTELEVGIAESLRDRQGRQRALLTLGGALREHGAVQDEPPVARALRHAVEEALRAAHPAARDGEVPVIGAVKEREPARRVRRLHRIARMPVRGEGALLQRDGAVVLPEEVRRLAEAVERLGALDAVERLLEAGPCGLPVGGS
jgi:hypothetical protein